VRDRSSQRAGIPGFSVNAGSAMGTGARIVSSLASSMNNSRPHNRLLYFAERFEDAFIARRISRCAVASFFSSDATCLLNSSTSFFVAACKFSPRVIVAFVFVEWLQNGGSACSICPPHRP
jgi:hypothetical protein